MLTQVTDLIFPLVDFGRADNAHYPTETYLGAEYLMSLNGLAAEQGLEVYSDLVADFARQWTEMDGAAAEEKRSPDDNPALRTAEQVWIDTDLAIEPADPAVERPATPTGDAHLRTIQLLDCDDIVSSSMKGSVWS